MNAHPENMAEKPSTRLFSDNTNIIIKHHDPDDSWVEDNELEGPHPIVETINAINLDTKSQILIQEPDTLGNFLLSETAGNRKTRTEMIFKFKYFIVCLFDHCLFFMLLGPFIYFYGCFSNMNRLRNEGFVGYSATFVEQTLIWIFVISSTLVFFLTKPDRNIGLVELLMLYFSIFIRCVFIAVKYSYCSEDYLRAFVKRKLTYDEISSELMGTTWRQQKDSVIEKELQSNILNEDVDCSLFFFNFIGGCHKGLCKKLVKKSGISQRGLYSLVPVNNFGRKLRGTLGIRLPPAKKARRDYAKKTAKKSSEDNEKQSAIQKETLIISSSKKNPLFEKRGAIENAMIEFEKNGIVTSDNPEQIQKIEVVITANNIGITYKKIDLEAQNAASDQHIMENTERIVQTMDSRQNTFKEYSGKNTISNSISDLGVTTVVNPLATTIKGPTDSDKIHASTNSNHVRQLDPLPSPQTIDFGKLKDDEKLKYQAHEIVTMEFERLVNKSGKFETTKLFGYSLALDLLQHAKKERFLNDRWLSLALAIIRSLLPTIYRIYEKYVHDNTVNIFGTTWSDHYIVFSLMIANCFFFWVNLFIALQSVSDYRVKRFLMLQLGNLIAAREVVGYNIKRLYPTLNLFDPITVKMWASLRKILWRYGSKYQIRQHLDITVYTVFYLVLICILIMQWLRWLHVSLSPMAVILFSYECLVVSTLFGYILILAALTNDTFNFHMNLLKKIKVICGDMLHLDFIYFGKKNFEAHNYVYRAGIQMLVRELGGDKVESSPRDNQIFLQKLGLRLSKLITMIGEEIEDLAFGLINNPYRILGFNINWKLISTLVLGIGSVAFGVIKQQF